MAQQPLLVTAALILDGDQILVAQRKADSLVEANKWEFPGGKVDLFEHPEMGLAREIREELGLEIAVDRFYMMVSHIYDVPPKRVHIVLLCYLCHQTGGELRHLDVQDSKWLSIRDLGSLDFALADLPVVAKLKDDWTQLRLGES